MMAPAAAPSGFRSVRALLPLRGNHELFGVFLLLPCAFSAARHKVASDRIPNGMCVRCVRRSRSFAEHAFELLSSVLCFGIGAEGTSGRKRRLHRNVGAVFKV